MTPAGDAPVLPELRVLLLGPFAVYRDDRLLDTDAWQRTVATLLKLLATAHEGRRLRDEIVDVLWPDASPEAGASNLRYVLSLLRKNLGAGDPPPILAERGWVALNPVRAWDVDLTRFERLIRREDRASLEEAMRLYRGEPLEEHRYDDWAMPLRERLRREWRDAGLRLAALAREAGEREIAIAWLEKLLAQDPLDEEAFRPLLPLLSAAGRRTEALRRYTRFEDQLRRELGVAPSVETAAEAAAVHETPTARTTASATESPATEPARHRPLPVGAYLGSLPAGPLVGRAQELNTIMSEVEAASRGEGRLVLLAGEPGVGKTRLAQEITRRLDERGFLIIAGRCYEIEQSAPYYPFLDAIGALLDALPPSLRQQVPDRWPYLGRLLPDLVPTALAEGAAVDEQQYLYRAVTGLLDAASQRTPIALLLDDLHWSDAASLRLLLHIARHSRASRVFLLGAYRDVEVGRHHPLERALLDLGREDLVTRVAVRRLDREETGALVAATLGEADVPGAIVDLIHEPTEGNPFFVQQLVRSMRDRGDLYRVDGHWERRERGEVGVPESVRAAVGQRLSRLSETTQEVLRDASVLGQNFLFDDLQALGARDEQALETAVEEACAHGLVHALAGDEYSFDHALTWQTVIAELSARRKRRTHLAAAEAIARRAAREREEDRRAAEIAWHYLEAGAEEEALPWSLRAGDVSEAAYAHDEAELHYRTALDLAVELDDRAREAQALEKLGEVLITVSRQTEARPLEERALQLYRALDDPIGEGRAATRIAWVHAGLGTFRESIEDLQAAIARLEPLGPSQVLVDLHAALGFHLTMLGRPEEALAHSDQWEQLARETGYERYVTGAQNARGFLLWQMGRRDEGLAIIESTLPQLEAVGDLFSLSSNLRSLGYACLEAGDLQGARERFERALEVNVRRNDPTAIANTLTDVAFLEYLEGKWDDALHRAERAVTMVEDRVDQPFTAYPMGFLGMLRVYLGEHEGIEAQLQRTIEIASAMWRVVLFAYGGWAEYDLQRGRPYDARTRLEAVVASADVAMWSVRWIHPILARACLSMGDMDAAAAVLSTVAQEAKQHRNRVVDVEIAAVEGELLIRRGRPAEAQSTLARALADAREIGLPYDEARILLTLSEAQAQHGQREAAQQALKSALTIFARLGARPDLERARERQQSLWSDERALPSGG